MEKTISYKYKIYEKIREDIITGQLQQGDVLNERDLADEMGISRTPIREAFQLLARDGWLINEPYKGVMVRKLDYRYIVSVLSVRKALEILVTEEAAVLASEQDIETLDDIVRRMDEYTGVYSSAEDFMKLDWEFHQYIYQLSKNVVADELLRNFYNLVMYFGIRALQNTKRRSGTVKEHQKIVDALRSRNVRAARRAADVHLSKTEEVILKVYTINF